MPAYVSSIEVRPMPNLENLKKQAKLYLRWHRDRHYPVAARIRAVLPRFRHLSDRGGARAQLQAVRRAGTDREEGRVRELGGAPQRSPDYDRHTI